MNKYLNETKLLDYKNPTVLKLVSDKKWNALNANDKILNIYNYVRDSITFGYNKADDIPASRILKDGYGQCNTKGILFMALLRSVGIPCRMHGFTIDKKLQKGAINGLSYRLGVLTNIFYQYLARHLMNNKICRVLTTNRRERLFL